MSFRFFFLCADFSIFCTMQLSYQSNFFHLLAWFEDIYVAHNNLEKHLELLVAVRQ